MATTADFKSGMCLNLEGRYYYIVEFLHVKPGKGPAFVRTKLKSVTTGRVIEKTFNAGVKIDEVRIERRLYLFLYQDDMIYHFMQNETFEQVFVERNNIVGVDFLKEGDMVEIVVHADSETILFAEIPIHAVLTVIYTEPGIKGDTATNATKLATIETGASIRVPLFINKGDKIKVDTRNGSYVERVK
ncbi:MAG: elongation factor P [Candidatus Azobacteroides pseudotrichonymphae]|jgi:elongation factor P|uniref:Elongation factor P n=1 Tax=Azobacteroides pseudotrichonymphae genomovar. CFP2 TaxID=511995 RepID=EFP_AZOPC|nr:elongation factor P [Candidatus Azobacteroides pseudotrichonymphae]B6YQT1.1 RecName: Full=Elongation factor P; Short=EF-P [Candidatus Azobacteroides pseudotrichonymphae genomovar. CFP2]BAG83553.1 translation elongation factor P [Candidatus Azobacteroides pseudotrichonymphae genomovar. CFP2]GMO32655.1 MAG: elongation factor P [Candidatus Azobacteroides pseudotrichonymphae]